MIFVFDVLQPDFQNLNRIVKLFISVVRLALLSIQIVFLYWLRLVFVLQTLLKFLDLKLKLLFAIL